VKTDIQAITALYQSIGFREAEVTPEVSDEDKQGQKMKLSVIRVAYNIKEGPQSKFGTVDISGNTTMPMAELRKLMNSQSGQPYSVANLSGDRDAMLNYYLSKGFTNAQMDVSQIPEKDNPQVISVNFRVTEGPQSFINHIFISGLHYTRPFVVNDEL